MSIARVDLDTTQEAQRLSAYLQARGMKTEVDAPSAGAPSVVVHKPALKGGDGFIKTLRQMVEGWLGDGHARAATIDWKGEQQRLGSAA
jgi:hypothetical protein